jgi:hypothetical protein
MAGDCSRSRAPADAVTAPAAIGAMAMLVEGFTRAFEITTSTSDQRSLLTLRRRA